MQLSNISVDILEDVYPNGMPDTAALIAGPYLVTLTLLGVLENILVLVTFARHRILLNSNNLLVMFLALCDLLAASTSFPFIAAASIANRWVFSMWACQWYAASMTAFGLTSISLLMSVAIDRYIIIVVKTREHHILAKSRAKKFAVACYAWGIIIALCPLFGWGSYDLEPVFPSCSPVWSSRDPNNFSFIMTIFTAAFFFPLCLILFVYIRIFMKVREGRKLSLRSASKEIQVAFISLTMIAFFLLSWGPYALVALIQAFCTSCQVPDLLNIIPVMMAKSSIVWNPIIYLGRNTKFRQAFFDDVTKVKGSFQARLRRLVPPKRQIQSSSGQLKLKSVVRVETNKVVPSVSLAPVDACETSV